MLSTASPWSHQTFYTPSRPSPLSSLPPNACQRSFGRPVMMERFGSNKDIPFSKRAIKANPVVQTRDAVKERRRDMFFKKVQQDRDDRRWASRGEQLLRLDFVAEQKRWEAEKAKEAPNAERDLDDYVSSGWNSGRHTSRSQQRQDADANVENYPAEEADHILEQENRELDALISSLNESHPDQDDIPQGFGSDDDDYDALFMDLLGSQEKQQQNSGSQSYEDNDAMDIS
ncbi:uncharacterized protein BDZ99DRAFT_463445 [Mytilinidion resinicola]|uniref:Uncharacterized protein n=1 Tax=Mytilinidion resinicola TaxID=574789 RepID=A0A6A6YLL2_9PEZI|nr:uncharacterized protein BDZ99DRAFT_463445 [Mytilinidion resinicola]KAF2809671.1 hypothetical protein BDZ99DRAFT_463445 [Mytilinidion resinicola]